MRNLFDVLPRSFFNYLSSASQNRVYSACLLEIYRLFDRQISFRLPRADVRDTLSAYLLENHARLEDEEEGEYRTAAEMASAVLRKFTDESVGWLEEDTDDATYEKQIIMTERGVMLAEFLLALQTPEKEEYSSFIIVIHDLLENPDIWREHPYINGLKNIYKQARLLSGALKKLGTYIRKIIERMVREETLESLTENIIEYCDGSFIREYARLTRQQNIHVYRSRIRPRMNRLREDPDMFRRLAEDCAVEENLTLSQAEDQVLNMLLTTGRFLYDDYDRIMQEIKDKINMYLQMAIGRARFLRSREADARGNVERMLRYLAEEMKDMDLREELPEDLQEMFRIGSLHYLDASSLRYPRKNRAVTEEMETELTLPDPEDIQRQQEIQTRESDNPWSMEQAREWLKVCMGARQQISTREMPIQSRRDLLMGLAAVAYARQNGYEVIPEEGYMETENLILRNFTIRRTDEKGA